MVYRDARGIELRPFSEPVHATLLRRYKRFLADVRLPGGRIETVHCPNPGAMTTCSEPGSEVVLSPVADPRRKLRYTWELIRCGRSWVCVNTAAANRVVRRRLEDGSLFPGCGPVRREVRCGDSRIDFALGDTCLLEVKSVTLARGGVAAFPDAVTRRGLRHIEELARAARSGLRAIQLYFVARGDVREMRPADEVDAEYGRALRAAARDGVEIVAVRASFSPRSVRMGPFLPVRL